MFNKNTVKERPEVIPTFNGGKAIVRKSEEELALTVLGSYMDSDMYYESQNDRIKRLSTLVDEVDDSFVEKLAVVARQEFNLRTPPSVLLALKTLKSGQPMAQTISSVLSRGDEVMEYLAAVKALSNKKIVIPSAKKTAAIGLQKLTERSALRYSGGSKEWSMSDALRVVHPTPVNDAQSALFNFIVNKDKTGSVTKGWESLTEAEQSKLPLIAKTVRGENLEDVSWESARSAGETDWTVLVPKMGYMAILRNLRNFLESVPTSNTSFWSFVANKISDEKEVRNSKQMPYRFYTAYKIVESTLLANSRDKSRILNAISTALDYSAWNMPVMEGNTLVAVDVSGSMSSPVSSRDRSNPGNVKGENLSMLEIAAVFGAAAAIAQNATLVAFGTTAKEIGVKSSVMETVKAIRNANVGHGTDVASVERVVSLSRFNNMIILTDGQFNSYSYGFGHSGDMFSNFKGKIFFADLTGYKPGFALSNQSNVRTIGGFSDAVLKVMALDSKGGIVEYIKNKKY